MGQEALLGFQTILEPLVGPLAVEAQPEEEDWNLAVGPGPER